MNKVYNIITIFSLLISCFLLAGCGEDPPYPPRTYYGNVEEVVIKDVAINSVKGTKGPILNKKSRIAVLSFKSPEDTQGGILVSDVLSLQLQKQGFNVVERDHIDKILKEHDLVKGNSTALSDLAIANTLGKLISADFMVFGAVTLYKSEGQVIYLPVYIKQEDRESYSGDYNKYSTWYLKKWLPFGESKEERLKRLRSVDHVLSLDEMEEELKKVNKTEFKNIASIGISAKIVDVKTTKIDWMGQGETVDFTLVSGANRILEKFIQSIQHAQ